MFLPPLSNLSRSKEITRVFNPFLVNFCANVCIFALIESRISPRTSLKKTYNLPSPTSKTFPHYQHQGQQNLELSRWKPLLFVSPWIYALLSWMLSPNAFELDFYRSWNPVILFWEHHYSQYWEWHVFPPYNLFHIAHTDKDSEHSVWPHQFVVLRLTKY